MASTVSPPARSCPRGPTGTRAGGVGHGVAPAIQATGGGRRRKTAAPGHRWHASHRRVGRPGVRLLGQGGRGCAQGRAHGRQFNPGRHIKDANRGVRTPCSAALGAETDQRRRAGIPQVHRVLVQQ